MKKLLFKPVLFYATLFFVSSNHFIHAQNDSSKPLISFTFKDKPLREVLQEIAHQSKSVFVFCDRWVDGKTISCTVNNLPIEEALHKITTQAGLSFKIFNGESIVLFVERSSKTSCIDERDLSGSNKVVRFTPPVWQEYIEPDYPVEAKTSGVEGTVGMNLFVTEKGEVKLVQITKSSGYQILDDAATEFAKKLTFDPARNGDKPIGVWMSWVMDYKLAEKRFFPMNYIQKIKEFDSLVNQSTGKERSRILQEIFNTHEDMVRYFSDESSGNYNHYIKEIVKDEVYGEWKDIWNDWPLHYLVFHDFVLRYPDSDETSKAIAYLIYYMKKDIARIKETMTSESNGEAKRDLFLKTMYTFLAKRYPQAITENLKEEVNTYLHEK